MHALDWFGDIGAWLLSLVPRLYHVRSTHAAVRFTLGKASVIRPGIHFYWPICSMIREICTVRQTLNLPWQNIVSSDGVQIVIAVTIVYEVFDPFLALTTTDDVLDTISDLSANAIIDVAGRCPAECVRRRHNTDGKNLSIILRHKIGSDLKSYGVRVRRAFVSDVAEPFMVRLISNQATFN